MKWKTIYTRPKEGEKRTVRKFAFLPTVIGEYTVWFETYESLQEYRYAPRATKAGTIWHYKWDEIDRYALEVYP